MANLYQRTAIAIAVATCFPATVLANAARVDFAVGNVTATGPDGKSRTLTRGAEISQGDTVSTQNGRAQLRFADGAYMSLQPQTEFKIEEFNFAGREDGKEGIVMNLIKGGMRTITGLIGRSNRHSYKLKTEVATIGIRGTEYSVQYTNSIEVFCAGGSINVENQGGSLTISGGQGAQVQTQQQAPQQTSQPPVLSPTSTTQQKQEEEQQQAASEPTNPVQESTTPDSTTSQLAAATTATTKKLFSGTFAGNGGIVAGSNIFNELNQQGTFDDSGALISFTSNTLGGTLSKGTATATSQGNDSIVAWGRWTGGTTSGAAALNLSSLPLHYVVGLPTTNMPTSGTATYSMMGSTTPSSSGGLVSSASVAGSTISVDFGSSSASMQLQMLVNGATTPNFTANVTLGRVADRLSSTGATFSWTTGAFCNPAINTQGFLSGDGASRAGMAYRITDGTTSSNINGAVA